jgi:uncharacterized protein
MTLLPFDPWPALAGGLLIGCGAALLLLANGRIAGISGMISALLAPKNPERGNALRFLLGLVAGAALALLAGLGVPLQLDAETSPLLLMAAGLAVGIGARWANGCTSGHGICGIGRLSPRSLLATAIFMATAAVTLYISRHLLGA